MPKKPASICRNPQCHRKTHDTYCTSCQQKGLGKKKYGFSSELHPWYQHKLWRGNPNAKLGNRGGLRELQLMEEPYCKKCKEEEGVINDVSFGGVVDHIKPWRQGNSEAEKWSLFTDFDNLQTLCQSCHNRKSAKESNR